MKFSSPSEFRDWPHKAITVFGMSGVGKTTLSRTLLESDWFQYSVDYRIGTRYMGEHIADNVKREAMKVPFLRDLLRSDSIHIASNITFDNLEPLSAYLGKPGKPERGGLSLAEYSRRQAQHREAEISALLDIKPFIKKAHDIYGYQHFVCDTGGSLCEVIDTIDLADPVVSCLVENTVLLYIEGTDAHARMLEERFRKSPKPLYYRPEFLEQKWVEYKNLKGIALDTDVDPDDFATWGYGELLRHRIPLYSELAQKYGYSISMDAISDIKSEADFINLVGRLIEQDTR